MPDAQAREEDGKPPSQHVVDEMAKLNIIAARLGPGPHLKGRSIMGGIVKPEEVSLLAWALLFIVGSRNLGFQFDCFHEMIMGQEVARLNARGYYDGLVCATHNTPIICL